MLVADVLRDVVALGHLPAVCAQTSSYRAPHRTTMVPQISTLCEVGTSVVSFFTTFFASGVEAVEALTIVLGVGVVARLALAAAGRRCGVFALGAIVAALGPALDRSRSDASARRRRAAARLRAAVAAQGDSAGERLQGAARRGRGVPRASASRRARLRRLGGRDGLVRVHGLVQGRVARRPRGRVHRASASAATQGRTGLAAAAAAARWSWSRSPGSSLRSPLERVPGERDQVRRRSDAHQLRDLLGRRGRRRRLAGRRRRDPRDRRVHGARVVRARQRSCAAGGSSPSARWRPAREAARRSARSGGTSSSATTGCSRRVSS